MTLPIPAAPTTLALLPLAAPPAAPGAAPANTEVVAFRDALAAALGDPAAPRVRQRTAGAGDAMRTGDARRHSMAAPNSLVLDGAPQDAEEDAARVAGELAGEPATDDAGGAAPGGATTDSDTPETGVVAGRRAHRSEGATHLEAEDWAPAIVITPVAVPTLPTVVPVAASAGARNDARDVLVPEFRGRLERVITRMEQEYGYTVEVIETGRTQERQDALYSQGRTTPGPIVTWTRSSRHTHGLAADVTIDGGWTDRAAFERLAVVAREEGLRTLGARDPGHIELPAFEGARATPPASQVASPRWERLVATGTPTDDPVGHLFERGQPRQGEGRMSILPIERGEVAILPVRTPPGPGPDGMKQILPVDAGTVSALPIRTPRTREAEGMVQILPVDAGEVSILPVRQPVESAPDDMLHILPAPREERRWPIERPRAPGDGLVRILPAAGVSAGLPGEPGAARRGSGNIELSKPAGLPEGRPTGPVVATVATVASVASVAATAQVAAVATPGTPRSDSPRSLRAGARPSRDVSEATGRTGRDTPLAPVTSPREVIASAEQAAAARLWSPPSATESSRQDDETLGRTEPSDELLADLVPSFTPDGDAWGALAPEREGLLRPDRADGPQAIERTDAAERIARALRLQDEAGGRPVSSVMLRLDHPEGGEDRIRVDLRGRSVGATLDVSDANAADHLRAHTHELHQALERAGLEGERLVVRAAADSGQALASAAGAERDSVRAASTPSGHTGTGASPRDPRTSREPNHSQRDHDQPASRQRRDQGDRR